MQVGTGISILNGIAIGKIKIFKAPTYEISDSLVEDPIPELDRYEKARVKAQEQQNALYKKAVKAAGEDSAGIFEFHAEMLDDDDLNDSVKSIIADQKHTAEYAVKQGFANMAQMFKEMDNPYFQARSTDVIDVGNCVLDILLGNDTESMQGTEPCILVAEDLAPSDTVKLDKSKLLGMITREGSSNSHTAILARSMNTPTLIQCKQIDDSWDGKFAILDGYNSCVYVEPTQDLIDTLTAKHNEDLKKEALLKELKGKTNTTIDGRTIKVFANIGGPQDIGAVQENDAEGIGLFRSEFVYLGSTKEPTEDEQFEAYKRVVETLAPKLVVIRTCDIGTDKTIDWMNLDHETNPALGYRAIRICLTRKDFFKRQLRALLRASAYGNMGIMFPMIISVREVREAKEILAECRRELENENVKMGNPQIGIMVETPAAVLCADELAEEVDFFSLGTNDLTQYTTAIDRVNAKLEPFADSHHPAVLREIKMTIDAGHRHNCWVGICGELGADLALTETFLRMGIDELSVNAKSVLPLRKEIRSIDLSKPMSEKAQKFMNYLK
ncbi:MAG: phosphoenolpyruvate--protein phosphotransferase [Lachnospiraceae bacterium]|jgi:phosphotransferase system enzyme I (PtsI)|nr:phosphoenolpyruvate--protein phosphotransferase [Lachnospiraceae bacterium]MCH4029768.1 phosphoenolpyruvate--protein phosphotransferase [Lachnospiraceae bacterium]MCH4067380.1 phosphoenolpyruvate--protein phosphotransferase [Lachnospiraceae bacterium]MCH4113404.1 phosphoenolpyruvate--protein phosphotransferase [Lachnospiraceae bacterium]MCI1352964.1 phosphoenolpyruvate--protein phosphotransferase [Lachnospiraceae bacterium]